ncbi:DUF305 domain-containing protein [Rhodococcus sp. BP-252]|uniref:DUF305 domain-containing protein n=1 Tax=unclassified Rhodococcus (in: high G+C Gram-positive bacteria) TaxID=192944 RepID=UPI001C9B4ECC|nr:MULTISPECIES: DUF305 domain-containing protein [unclassified Rhodococcus (in: high G+C Gram-positive bacteria)]MBY6413919.1 DUF305 domain-containing protein [Rhodococcus sp. BP-320]MBY6418631.1 DUF305 domain-containing protein [Rhodococcus sp. BP-321]MBY6422926.1 DUF305 domain-containing protein [Rhodococcus sp. BP-324]MBY6428725.1 DUF305 domain-containing protein [Rhodococcus sp. BP-323]MBY6433752.1 DUF305 domain-containing protein [Rhodococcus sp. BP-322]
MRSNRSTRFRIAITAASAVAAAVLAGCSSNDGGMDMPGMSSGDTPASSSSEASADASAVFNDADVTFVQGMYPHHAQAVDMSSLVDGRTENAQIIELAQAIEAAQAPEMEQMNALLAAWGQPAASTDMGGMDMGGMDMGSGGMSGMMSQEDMDRLSAASGAEFDSMWLTMMIEHHKGAIEMAQIELTDGSNPDAKELASTIIDEQQSEISTMEGLLVQ